MAHWQQYNIEQSLSNTFIYADAKTMTFEELMKSMEELTSRIRGLDLDCTI